MYRGVVQENIINSIYTTYITILFMHWNYKS